MIDIGIYHKIHDDIRKRLFVEDRYLVNRAIEDRTSDIDKMKELVKCGLYYVKNKRIYSDILYINYDQAKTLLELINRPKIKDNDSIGVKVLIKITQKLRDEYFIKTGKFLDEEYVYDFFFNYVLARDFVIQNKIIFHNGELFVREIFIFNGLAEYENFISSAAKYMLEHFQKKEERKNIFKKIIDFFKKNNIDEQQGIDL